MPQEYDQDVMTHTAEELLAPLRHILQHASLQGASVLTCLLLEQLLADVHERCATHTLDTPPWLFARHIEVAQALEACLMQELLAAEEELRRIDTAAGTRDALCAKIKHLTGVLSLPTTRGDESA